MSGQIGDVQSRLGVPGRMMVTHRETYLPLYYQVDVHAIRRGLTGPGPRWPGQSGLTWNIHEWYWE